jgi:hypothetical protein
MVQYALYRYSTRYDYVRAYVVPVLYVHGLLTHCELKLEITVFVVSFLTSKFFPVETRDRKTKSSKIEWRRNRIGIVRLGSAG